jgi:hypothetical protein
MTEQPERTKEFELAAAPLVKYLADLHFNDPYHEFVLADIYDMVNEIRNDRIQSAKNILSSLDGNNEHNPFFLRRKKIECFRTITACQGV